MELQKLQSPTDSQNKSNITFRSYKSHDNWRVDVSKVLSATFGYFELYLYSRPNNIAN